MLDFPYSKEGRRIMAEYMDKSRKICKNCKWWKQKIDFELPEQEHTYLGSCSKVALACANDPNDLRWRKIFPTSTFGCIHWEEKK